MPYTDAQAYQAIADLVTGLNAFETVHVGAGRPLLSGDSYPACWICPRGFEQKSESDPEQLVRTCRFELRIVDAGQGGAGTFDRLDALAEQVAGVLAGNALEGALPGLTQILEGEYSAGQYPEEQTTLVGTFSYLRTT